MARKPRFNMVGAPHHVIQRGNNRNPCFYGEEDYSVYLEFLDMSLLLRGINETARER